MTVPAWVKASAASLGLGGAIGLFAALALVGGECSAWRQDHPKPKPPVAVQTQPTAASAEMDRIIEDCLAVQTLQPTPAERKRIAKDSGRADFAAQATAPAAIRTGPVRPAQGGEIVAPAASGGSGPDYPVLLFENVLPAMPAGGIAWGFLEMDGSGSLTVKPNPVPKAPAERFFEFANVFELGGLYGIGQGGDTRSRAWGAWEPVRLGRIHLRAEAGVDLRAGQSDGYVMGGAVWRSR